MPHFVRSTIFFLLCICSIRAYAQLPGDKISLNVRNVSLKEVFNQITAKTGYALFYSNQQINDQQKVSLNVKEVTVQDILKTLLGEAFTWRGKDKVIHIKKKEAAPRDSLVSTPALTDTSVRITGKITDQKGELLLGASIKLKGTDKGVVTDEKGEYVLQDVTNGAGTLIVSYIGFQTREVPIRSRSQINVSLMGEGSTLNDVVVIGYGTVRKKDVTASVSSISKEAMSERTIFSLADAMKGKAAGVQITQNDGTPGSESTIRIRGASSISGGSTPLYVIDGVMQEDANSINPGDIESIEILKDASGTAIYGARGANGVIMITTKTGKAGKTVVELYSNTGFQQPGHLFAVMDAREYARARFLASSYTYTPADPGDPNKPASELAGYTYYRDSPLGKTTGFWGVAEDNTYHDWYNYNNPDSANTNWQKAMFQNSAVQEYRINVLGGSKDTKFSFMGGYLNQGGLIVYSGYERFNGRFNLQQRLSKSVTITSNISGSRTGVDGFISGSQNGGITSNSVITSMLNQPPTKPLTFSDIEDNEGIEGYITTNPYSLAKNVTNKRYSTEWVTRLALDWAINNHFTFRTTGNYSTVNTNTDAYYPKNTSSGSKFGGRAVLARGDVVKMMNENLLYYKGNIGRDHTFNIMGGAIFEVNKNSLVTAENQHYDIELLGPYGLSNGSVPVIPAYGITKWTMASFLGRAEYNYKQKYMATLTMRADGSSRFSEDNKWGYFPSAAIAWRASEESFIRAIHDISNLKFRASLGQSGNTAIPSYLTLSTITTYFSPMDGNTPNYGVVVERPENRSLKWETTTQVDAGMDLGLWNDKVNITVDWYLKRTKDLLIELVTPGYSGYRSAWANLGSVQNSGLELNISSPLITTKQFSWALDGNIGFNRSKAIDVGADLNLDPGVVSGIGTTAIIRNGQPIGQWFGYQTNGIFQSQEEINSSGLKTINGQDITKVRPGTRKFIDQNGDGIINTADRVVLGQGQPDFTGGITNSLHYKGFNLNIVVQYSYGNKLYNANRVALEHGRSTNNMAKASANSWRPSLYDMNTGALVEQGNPNNEYRMPGSPEELLMLSDWIEDGSFIRLSDITLSYSLSAFHIANLTFFVSGKNLWIHTKYSGYDPEVNTRQGGFGDLMPSLDYASYPRSRVYSFGLKAQF
ncbi:TonB-dependent receptor [Chitinophaga agrisoli]|uniref:TonB-dependent receptor n=1 Tax=Chitinophaga agrisoli TaxID=2607653 RepID=A0A5B2VIT4_9BACT|nr:TonB-dependent receptor [Chitinophaga agrisoli]KAA2238971.1 TonB-dependent receptor [Chitinophaga agrisoli]